MINGDVSFWYADLGGVPEMRPPLPSDRDVDVAIVGGGYTGLWTAYYLKKANPSLRIAIVEKHFAGFGASGRNGGWLSGEFGWSRERYAKDRGRDAVLRLQRAMWDSVDEVIGVCAAEGIEADIIKGGVLRYAVTPAQRARLEASWEYERSWGATAQDLQILDRDELQARISVDGAVAADWGPHAARIQPAALVRGLARVVSRMGMEIYEGTTVLSIDPGRVTTDHGVVKAESIVRATEGFTAGLPGHRRDWLPMNSAMIVTEPLTSQQWDEIGWNGYEVVGDSAHAYLYAQRTREGRIAIGGRGVPYRFGSATDVNGQTQERTIELLRELLQRMFPLLDNVEITHAWCGVLGVPRDWCATVGFDPATRIGWAGGYVGIGVATSNLAARSLTALILDTGAPEADLAFVNRQVRKWEPEPLRWLGVHALYRLYRAGDAHERQSGSSRDSRLARIASKISGR
jgi:glycine/D-amino acid oxidase-like deaminating enzyme